MKSNKPSWQTEFDKAFITDVTPFLGGLHQYWKHDDNVSEIKAFIQDLLDRKAREIEGLKKPIRYEEIDTGIGTCLLDYDGQEADQIYNQALDQALSILKEER